MKENIDENVVLLLPPMKDTDLTKGEDKPFILYKPSEFSNDEEIGCEENHCDHKHPSSQTVHPNERDPGGTAQVFSKTHVEACDGNIQPTTESGTEMGQPDSSRVDTILGTNRSRDNKHVENNKTRTDADLGGLSHADPQQTAKHGEEAIAGAEPQQEAAVRAHKEDDGSPIYDTIRKKEEKLPPADRSTNNNERVLKSARNPHTPKRMNNDGSSLQVFDKQGVPMHITDDGHIEYIPGSVPDTPAPDDKSVEAWDETAFMDVMIDIEDSTDMFDEHEQRAMSQHTYIVDNDHTSWHQVLRHHKMHVNTDGVTAGVK